MGADAVDPGLYADLKTVYCSVCGEKMLMWQVYGRKQVCRTCAAEGRIRTGRPVPTLEETENLPDPFAD